MKKTLIIYGLLMLSLPMMAQQSEFDKFKQQQSARFDQFKADKQAEFDAFRQRVNQEYADFMRQAWKDFPVHEAEKPKQEPEVKPVVYEEPTPAPTPAPQPAPSPQPEEKEKPTPIAVKPTVVVVPAPQPAPEPIAPVQPKEETYKKVSVGYYGTIITLGFPVNDNLHIAALNENAIADAWQQLSDKRYDITVKTALDARKTNRLCDWAYMSLLQRVSEKQYGRTNEAVLMQAFLMVQSGYRIRLGMSESKLYMLVASLYDIYGLSYYTLDGTKFYRISDDKSGRMQICKACFDKERSLSLQLAQLPKLGNDMTPKRTLTSKRGVTASVCVNKNLIDFFNTYPQSCINGDFTTRWAAYANTPLDKSVKDMLYPPLKRTVGNMGEREAVGILLNWVQTAFTYKVDDQVWGADRAFFAQETLYYPYCDCEDRAILFSRLVRDLMGLDVVLLYYPGHLAAAVAFNGEQQGDYLVYKNRRYVVCDPTYINAGIGRTMPGMNNREAQIIALK